MLLIMVWAVASVGQPAESGGDLKALVERSKELDRHSEAIQGEMKLIIESIQAGDNSSALRNQYLELELSLLSLRGEITSVKDSLVMMGWSVTPEPQTAKEEVVMESSDARAFSQDSRVVGALREGDLENLKQAESMESALSLAINDYILRINEIAQVRDEYNLASSQSDGLELESEYRSLLKEANKIASKIAKDWSYIYDNKSYSYNLMLELNSKESAIKEVSALRDSTLRESAKWSVEPIIAPLKSYTLQKRELLAVEMTTSRAMDMEVVADSVRMVYESFSMMGRDYPTVELTPRTFIDYKDAEIAKKQIYTASNPIPQTKIYGDGVIYRIRVGNFSKKQQPAIFRLSTEVSYIAEDNRTFTYYIGGYATYAEAEAAQSMLKAAGFRRPEVVVWSDGELRNLAENPYSQGDIYRIEISGCETLSDSMREDILAAAPNVVLSKLGIDTYAISPIQGEGLALRLSQVISKYGSDIVIELKKL
ncbi:MAG: hypothetical protein SNJ33_04445 [Rikenellaceae bacterium]